LIHEFVTFEETSYLYTDMCKFESSEKEESRAQSAAPRRPTAGFFISRFLRRKKTGKNLNSIPGSREKNV